MLKSPFFSASEDRIWTLEKLAQMGEAPSKEHGQIRLLIDHFLERFLNNEMISSDGEGSARLLLAACVIGLPNFVVALYLWALYHPLLQKWGRPYWSQVGDHFFFVTYSLAVMGIITVFEWDLFFPDLLDLYVLSSLPIQRRKLFLARIAAISILTACALTLANIFSTLVLPLAADPPNVWRFMAGHILAVAASGLFAAFLVLAIEGVLLAVFGARFFRRISLALQGVMITALLMLLCLAPVFAEILPALVRSGSKWLFYFPPYWFLGIYERIWKGNTALPVYAQLAGRGNHAMLLALALAAVSYPVAYWRATRQLVEGAGARKGPGWIVQKAGQFFHTAVCRIPARRAISHFIGQTLTRVPRYRIYFVIYGGLGFALVIAEVLRMNVKGGRIDRIFAPDGILSAIPIVAFWSIAGLRMAFLSPGDSRPAWSFRNIHGRPELDHLVAAKHWAFAWAAVASLGTEALLAAISPPQLRTVRALASQSLAAVGLSLLLADLFFLHVRRIPFTRPRSEERSNLATSMLKYFASFPPLVAYAPKYESWIAAGVPHMVMASAFVLAAHLWLCQRHRRVVAEHFILLDLDEDEEEFPLRLGLRA